MDEVAAFVDLENIRYSMLNRWHQEPDPLAWRDKARSYGLIGLARAYADFDQHPPQLRQRLNVAGIEAEHYPVKRYRDRDGTERIRSIADLHMVIDIVDTALGRPNIGTFLFFTGDGDFIRVVAMLRNRLGKRVVICGVPETTSRDLVISAGEEDMLDVSEVVPHLRAHGHERRRDQRRRGLDDPRQVPRAKSGAEGARAGLGHRPRCRRQHPRRRRRRTAVGTVRVSVRTVGVAEGRSRRPTLTAFPDP